MPQAPTGYSHLNRRYPRLAARIARLPLASLPTPLHRAGSGDDTLWIKRDDTTHTLYGGNKVRKLEYLLARARQRGARRIVTFGGVGSNHALATALHARQFELDCQCWLMPQRMTGSVSGTLQRHQDNGSDLFASPRRRSERVAALRALRAQGELAVVPLGGTSPLGSLGYVNAAFEFAHQWRGTPPARVYVAAGTMGTAAGLSVGFDLLDWPTEVIAVQVTATSECNPSGLAKLCAKIRALLHHHEPRIAVHGAPRVSLRTRYLGADYADPTRASRAAVDAARARYGLALETTYTGKVMACLLDELPTREPAQPWVYWHTYSGPAAEVRDLSAPYSDWLSLCREF